MQLSGVKGVESLVSYISARDDLCSKATDNTCSHYCGSWSNKVIIAQRAMSGA